MNRAVRVLNLPPIRNRDLVTDRISPARLVLTPIPWGKPDPKLAKSLCRLIVDATPAIVIPFNPLNHFRVRRALRSFGIHH